jgi:hypothetical protein
MGIHCTCGCEAELAIVSLAGKRPIQAFPLFATLVVESQPAF